jgi:hypothetical protein
MSRTAIAVLAVAVLALARCSKKEEVVTAAPVAPAAGAQAAPHAPGAMPGPLPPGAGDKLPPGHPSLDQPGQAPAPAAGGQGAAAAPPPAPPHGAAMSAGVDMGDVKVPKATGSDARTIAEVFAQKAALKDRTVTIRGKVVKYNAGIMGKNWIHLRDGTGTAGKDNDVTVTSLDATAVGEVVVVHGKVAVDQDIGMGAPYPVVVQDAKVTR